MIIAPGTYAHGGSFVVIPSGKSSASDSYLTSYFRKGLYTSTSPSEQLYNQQMEYVKFCGLKWHVLVPITRVQFCLGGLQKFTGSLVFCTPSASPSVS